MAKTRIPKKDIDLMKRADAVGVKLTYKDLSRIDKSITTAFGKGHRSKVAAAERSKLIRATLQEKVERAEGRSMSIRQRHQPEQTTLSQQPREIYHKNNIRITVEPSKIAIPRTTMPKAIRLNVSRGRPSGIAPDVVYSRGRRHIKLA